MIAVVMDVVRTSLVLVMKDGQVMIVHSRHVSTIARVTVFVITANASVRQDLRDLIVDVLLVRMIAVVMVIAFVLIVSVRSDGLALTAHSRDAHATAPTTVVALMVFAIAHLGTWGLDANKNNAQMDAVVMVDVMV